MGEVLSGEPDRGTREDFLEARAAYLVTLHKAGTPNGEMLKACNIGDVAHAHRIICAALNGRDGAEEATEPKPELCKLCGHAEDQHSRLHCCNTEGGPVFSRTIGRCMCGGFVCPDAGSPTAQRYRWEEATDQRLLEASVHTAQHEGRIRKLETGAAESLAALERFKRAHRNMGERIATVSQLVADDMLDKLDDQRDELEREVDAELEREKAERAGELAAKAAADRDEHRALTMMVDRYGEPFTLAHLVDKNPGLISERELERLDALEVSESVLVFSDRRLVTRIA